MLSAYETGKQKPSLDTLEKILVALECELNDLHNALQIVNDRPEVVRRSDTVREDWRPYRLESQEEADVYRVLGLSRQLPQLEEQALREMLEGFHKMVRYLHGHVAGGRGLAEREGLRRDPPSGGFDAALI